MEILDQRQDEKNTRSELDPAKICSHRESSAEPADGRDRWTGILCALAVASAGLAAPANATTFIPMSIEDLTDSSTHVVMGRVVGIAGVESDDGGIFTKVQIEVVQVLAGHPNSATVTLWEPGGVVRDRSEVVYGAPRYQPGENVVVFISQRADGTSRTNQLALGKFGVTVDKNGVATAAQSFGEGVTVLFGSDPSVWRPTVTLDELVASIQRTTNEAEQIGSDHAAVFANTEVSAPFELFPEPGRFFEPDEGTTLSFQIDDRGDAILGLDASRQAVQDAFTAWNRISGATVALDDGGLTTDLSRDCIEGEHKVLFDDPHNEISAPVNCTGTLGVGGFCSTPSETKTFNGTTFDRALRARLTFANDWQGCNVWTPCNLAEIATHEVGHSIGLWHSSEDAREGDAELKDATMYFLAHLDGRCAEVRRDDIDGISFIYPTELPPTITTASPLPEGVAGRPYSVSLTAIGGSGSITWSETTDNCQGFPGLSLNSEGSIEGTPNAVGTSCFQVIATDSNGDRHVKRLEIKGVQTASTPTIGARPTATRTEPPSATATPTVASDCTGDCNGDGFVTVNEVIQGVNIALGSLALDVCPVFDVNQDGMIGINELVGAVGFGLNGCP